jgi:Putative peptidoglycan binding domain
LGEVGDTEWRWLLAPEENMGTAAAAPGRDDDRTELDGRSTTSGEHTDLEDSQPASARRAPSTILRRRGAVVLLAVCALLAAAIAVPVIAFEGDATRTRALPAVNASPGQNASPQATTGGQSTPSTAPPPVMASAATPRAASQSPLTVELPGDVSLRAGQTGTAVLQLQNALSALGFEPGKPDGIFGNMTEAAVISFQKANDLSPDGVVGDETATKLNVALGAQGGSR